MSDYRDLNVFHKAHQMSKLANEIARSIRSSDYRYLKNQLLRSAHSVPSNIVEGSGQESPRKFANYLRISRNSANETEYHCFAAHDFGLIPEAKFIEITGLIEEVRRMLEALIAYLKKKSE
ncbi:MAG TPA: four helix bundle protein [Gemmatimonadaceae bacterium]